MIDSQAVRTTTLCSTDLPVDDDRDIKEHAQMNPAQHDSTEIASRNSALAAGQEHVLDSLPANFQAAFPTMQIARDADRDLVRAIVNADRDAFEAALAHGANASPGDWLALRSAAESRGGFLQPLLDAFDAPDHVLVHCAACAVWGRAQDNLRILLRLVDRESWYHLAEYAILEDTPKALEVLVEEGFEWPQPDATGRSLKMTILLQMAGRQEKQRVMEYLCRTGITSRYINGETAVRAAAWRGNMKLLSVALATGLSAHDGESDAFRCAVVGGHFACARMLEEHGASLEMVDLVTPANHADRQWLKAYSDFSVFASQVDALDSPGERLRSLDVLLTFWRDYPDQRVDAFRQAWAAYRLRDGLDLGESRGAIAALDAATAASGLNRPSGPVAAAARAATDNTIRIFSGRKQITSEGQIAFWDAMIRELESREQ